jgi:hypothetical protein
MASVTENYSKFEVPAVVWFLQAEGVSQREIHCRLVSVYGQNVFRQKYMCGAINFRMAEWHWMTSHTDENCVIVQGFVWEDWRVKFHEVA